MIYINPESFPQVTIKTKLVWPAQAMVRIYEVIHLPLRETPYLK